MSETKQATHSEPPWGWFQAKTGYAIIRHVQSVVADGLDDAHYEDDYEQIGYAELEGDAMLMASALDLQAALEALWQDDCDGMGHEGGSDRDLCTSGCVRCEVENNAIAAIAKARGQS